MIESKQISLNPFSESWVEDFLITPLEEGVHRLNEAFKGVDLDLVSLPKLSLKDRVVLFAEGFFLTFFPYFNALVWIFIETFGSEAQKNRLPGSEHPGSPAHSPHAQRL